VSISLSLTALDITNHPEAVQLLSILCHLPDGLGQWEERLPHIGAGFQNVHYLVHLLYKTSLIFMMGDRLKVLSPIRHFITSHHPADQDHMSNLEKYFWDLVHTYATEPLGLGFKKSKEILEPDIGNISCLVKHALKIHPSTQIVEIILEVSQFLLLTIPSTELLNEVKLSIKQIGSPVQEAQVSQISGDILHVQCKYSEAFNNFLKLVTLLVQPNVCVAWVTFFACRTNTLKPPLLLLRLERNSSQLAMSWVQPNAYKAWVTFFACRTTMLKHPTL
jgi:hypothetical protein